MSVDASVYDFLKQVPLFADLPEADLRRLCQVTVEVRLSAGEELFAEGSAGDRAYVIVEGQLDVVKTSSGREVLLAVHGPKAVIGEMALLEDQPRMATVRARTASALLAIHKEQFDDLLSTSPSAVRTMFYTVLARWRATEAMLRQSEKMAQLGTLTAGVAHELNNPAAAVQRAAGQLQTALAQASVAQSHLNQETFTDAQRQALEKLAGHAQKQAPEPRRLDPLGRSDLEQSLERWLEGRKVLDAWELAPALVDLGYDARGLEELAAPFAPDQLAIVLRWLVATYETHRLVHEVGQGTSRISEIVKALKSYSYLDQAPVQSVDIHEGLNNTLLILQHKLKAGIGVRREYAADLPKIEGYGSELNQVWTNLIDNAADALEGRGGTIILRTRREGQGIAVEVEDDGPGSPLEIQPRIFDAFFTTKPPGHGTGLGLNITYNIVVHRHRGEIKVTSQPGKTCFSVWLPVSPQP